MTTTTTDQQLARSIAENLASTWHFDADELRNAVDYETAIGGIPDCFDEGFIADVAMEIPRVADRIECYRTYHRMLRDWWQHLDNLRSADTAAGAHTEDFGVYLRLQTIQVMGAVAVFNQRVLSDVLGLDPIALQVFDNLSAL